ncbi:hypothetical protein [Nioella aestuarii]|uniref:hypothetical protein n=1 Tax=Nioella aestuarii TaxID=1662864 RepID=UPI003D7FA3EE
MTRHANPNQITPLDHMIISAGGRTEAEFEQRMTSGTPTLHCRLCAIAADVLYRIVLRLEHRANRTAELSHRRMA